MYIIIDILYKYSGAKIHTKTIPQEARKHKKGLFKWHPPIVERSGIIISKKTSALIISPHNIPIKIQDTIFKIFPSKDLIEYSYIFLSFASIIAAFIKRFVIQ